MAEDLDQWYRARLNQLLEGAASNRQASASLPPIQTGPSDIAGLFNEYRTGTVLSPLSEPELAEVGHANQRLEQKVAEIGNRQISTPTLPDKPTQPMLDLAPPKQTAQTPMHDFIYHDRGPTIKPFHVDEALLKAAQSTARVGAIAKTGAAVLTGVSSEALKAALDAPEGKKTVAAISAAQEAITPGSTTAGTDVCKIAGSVTSGVVVWGGTGLAFLAAGGPALPFMSIPVSMGVAAVGSHYAPMMNKGIEAGCNAIVPESVKAAASTALSSIQKTIISLVDGDAPARTVVSAKPITHKGKH